MLRSIITVVALISLTLSAATKTQPTMKEDQFQAGTAQDIGYAMKLWRKMLEAKLVGEDATPLKPFFGGARPHGTILEIASQALTVGSHEGFVVVKKNYSGTDVNEDNVANNRAKYLKAYTVMYRREAGYDSDNKNWFWAKYKPDGSLFVKKTRKGPQSLAGRLFKGKTWQDSSGCIYCHAAAGGGDYLFYNIKLPD